MKNKKPIKSVRIVLDIVDELAEANGLRAKELAQQMGMSRSTVYDYLRTLVEEGYVLNDDGIYTVSYRFLGIGGRHRQHNGLFLTARPEIHKLAEQTDAIATLAIEERGFGVVIYSVSGGSARVLTHDGTYFYLHSAATGKAILANYPKDKTQAIIDRRGLPQITTETITDAEAFWEELDSVKQREYSTDSEELIKGMRGVGEVILDQTDESVIGALSLYTPVKRSDWEDLTEPLLESANIIEVNLQN